MIRKTDAKTALSVVLAVAVMLPLGVTGPASAEVSEEIRYRALEGKLVWERLEHIKNKEEKTAQDMMLAEELQKRFDEIAGEMNRHGIATPEQWEEDPDYWRMRNAPPMVAAGAGGDGTDPANPHNGDRADAAAASGPCFCPRDLGFIVGFDPGRWGSWLTSWFADIWPAGGFQKGT